MGKDTEDRHQKKILSYIDNQINHLQRQILDLTEIVVPPSNWQPLRSKILRITNDSRRSIEQELRNNYEVSYTPNTVYEDVVVIQKNKK